MTILLNHTIVPARDKDLSARFFAEIFGVEYVGVTAPFAVVRVNDKLTNDFDDAINIDPHHYAFHVSDAEFDAIFMRVRARGLPFGSGPTSTKDVHLNSWNGGRGFYFCDPAGHLLELLTRPDGPANAALSRDR
jgi:catechol 2,3-dioxygenase-like lactoylglutathione lyase family enzyme